MIKILSSYHQRHLTLLTFLMQEKWVTISELTTYLNCSEKSVRNDIKDINDYITPLIVETSFKNGVRLHIPSNFSHAAIYSKILHQSLEFQLLELIFLNETYSLNEFAEKFFISVSSVKRMIKRINDELVVEQFQITSPPLKLVGKEETICHFMKCLFEEKYMNNEWPFEANKLILMQDISSILVEKNAHISSFPDKTSLTLLGYIRWIRLKNGHPIGDDLIVPSLFDLTILEEKKIKQSFEDSLGCSFDKETLYRLFFSFSKEGFAINTAHLEELILEDKAYDEKYQKIGNFLDHFSQTLNIYLSNKEYLRLKLFNLKIKEHTRSHLLYHRKKIFFEALSFKNRYLHKIFLEEATAIFGEDFIQKDYFYDFVYVLIAGWENLVSELERIAPKIKVGLFLNKDFEHVNLLEDQLSFFSYDRLEVYTIEDTSIPSFKAHAKKFDLILTNLNGISLPETPVISFDFYPKFDTWFLIAQQYEQLTNTKLFT